MLSASVEHEHSGKRERNIARFCHGNMCVTSAKTRKIGCKPNWNGISCQPHSTPYLNITSTCFRLHLLGWADRLLLIEITHPLLTICPMDWDQSYHFFSNPQASNWRYRIYIPFTSLNFKCLSSTKHMVSHFIHVEKLHWIAKWLAALEVEHTRVHINMNWENHPCV